MLIVVRSGLALSFSARIADLHEVKLLQLLFYFLHDRSDAPDVLIGDRAFNRGDLDDD